MNDETPGETLTLCSSDLQQYYKAARWARFLAIIGVSLSCLMLLATFFAWTMMGNAPISSSDKALQWQSRMFIMALPVFALLYFIPSVLLYRFSVRAMNAVLKTNQSEISISVARLFLFFKYLGILTIIILAIYGLLIVITGIASVIGWGRY